MNEVKAVVLAAGKGTRMQSEQCNLPKVLREACGKPLLHYVLSALDFIPRENTILVVGYQREKVMDAFPGYPTAVQEPQMGTGHAVLCARPFLDGFDGTVLVCYGDMPLLRREVYEGLLNCHRQTQAACTFLTGTSELSLPYGRILRDGAGEFVRVVEDKDCTPEQRQIRELNVGIYCFDGHLLSGALDRLNNDNAQHEYYLTDVPGDSAPGRRQNLFVSVPAWRTDHRRQHPRSARAHRAVSAPALKQQKCPPAWPEGIFFIQRAWVQTCSSSPSQR